MLKHPKIINVLYFKTDVATEKSQQDLFHGIEAFDATKLKHAETEEKNPLPDQDGMYQYIFDGDSNFFCSGVFN